MYLFILEGRRNGLGSYSELSCSSSHRASTERASERAAEPEAAASAQGPAAGTASAPSATQPGQATQQHLPDSPCMHPFADPAGRDQFDHEPPVDWVAPKLSQSHAAKPLDSLFPPCGEGETALTPTTHRSLRRGIIGDKRDAALICFRPFAEALTVATAGACSWVAPAHSAHRRPLTLGCLIEIDPLIFLFSTRQDYLLRTKQNGALTFSASSAGRQSQRGSLLVAGFLHPLFSPIQRAK